MKISKILIINSVIGFGSTGHIVLDLAKEYEKNGNQVKIAYGRTSKVSKEIEADIMKYGVRIGSDMDVYYHVLYSRMTGKHGLASKRVTKRFLKWADTYDPDILWLHNIHGYYINYELLFQWIKLRPKMKVKWTLHDCWTMTGHCSHFTYVKCNKWQTECYSCPQLNQYPKSFIDLSRSNYQRKKAAFRGVQDLTIITPSNWLEGIVQASYLAEYPVEVVYNTIDKNVFKPTPSTFKRDHGLENKKMILGVASVWNERKGLNDFIELSKSIDPAINQIVLVGLNSTQIKELLNTAPNILALPRTNSIKELAQIYTAADIFVNPTYEDTFPTVNMEAEACGTPVITYDTCGCGETIHGEHSLLIGQGVTNLKVGIEKLKH